MNEYFFERYRKDTKPKNAPIQKVRSLDINIPDTATAFVIPKDVINISITASNDPIPPGSELAIPSNVDKDIIERKTIKFNSIPIDRKAK